MRLADHFTAFLERKNISQPTRKKYYYRLRRFVDAYGDEQPEDVTIHMIYEFINAQVLAEPSRALLRASFHAFLAFCGLGDDNPAKLLPRWRETPRRVKVPKEKEVKKALAEAVKMCQSDNIVDVRDGLVFMLAVMGGNRRGEIRNLRVEELLEALQFREENGIYRVYTFGKTGECILRFTDKHVPHIYRYLKMRPVDSEYVFINLNPDHERYGEQLSLVTFGRVRPKICQRAGVQTITYQELRRRVATIIAREEGVDVAAHALNHSPHSGDRVIRAFYYDPDMAAVDKAAFSVFDGISNWG